MAAETVGRQVGGGTNRGRPTPAPWSHGGVDHDDVIAAELRARRAG
jgi:hypothetical protein